MHRRWGSTQKALMGDDRCGTGDAPVIEKAFVLNAGVENKTKSQRRRYRVTAVTPAWHLLPIGRFIWAPVPS